MLAKGFVGGFGIGGMVMLSLIMLTPQTGSGLTITPIGTASGLNLAIPDDGYNGTLGSMASSTITVPALAENIIRDVNAVVAINHTFVGDLTIKLQSPQGTIVTLLNRPGILTADDGVQAGGDSSN